MSFFKGSVDLPQPEDNRLPEEEDAVLDKLAKKVVQIGMTVPAILFLETVKPLNFVASQILVFFEPVVQTLFNFRDYDTFRCALEKRQSVEILLLKIEKYDASELKREKAIKKYIKKEKKNWKWYQRWLGVFTPKIVLPDDIEAELKGKKPDKPEQ